MDSLTIEVIPGRTMYSCK